MAEALWRRYAAGDWEACSAGSAAAGFVHPMTLRVLEEAGVDCASARSKSVEEYRQIPFDLVVTVCGEGKEESCDVVPEASHVAHWPFDDPADATGSESDVLAVFRRVRDEIERRIKQHLALEFEREIQPE